MRACRGADSVGLQESLRDARFMVCVEHRTVRSAVVHGDETVRAMIYGFPMDHPAHLLDAILAIWWDGAWILILASSTLLITAIVLSPVWLPLWLIRRYRRRKRKAMRLDWR